MNKKNVLTLILISLFFVILINVIAYHLGADLNWDLLNYHFYNGYTFIHGKFISNSIQTIQSYLDPLLNSFYYLLISNFSPLLVNLTIASLQSIGIIMIFFLGLSIFNDFKFKYLISFLAALAAVFGPVFISEIGGTMGDTLLSFLVVISVFFIVKAIYFISDENKLKKALIYTCLSGFSIGLASGLKFTNLVYAIGLFSSFAIILLFITLRFKTKIVFLSMLGFSMFLSFILIYAPFGFILYENFKNPIFPYFNNIFQSPFAYPTAIRDERWIPINFIQYLAMPFLLRNIPWQPNTSHLVGMEIPFKTYFFAFIAILSPLYIFNEFKKIRSKNISYSKLLLILFFIFSYIIWLIVFAYYRYIAALEMIAPIVLLIIITSFYKNKYFYIFSGFAILFLSFLSYPYHTWGRIKPFPNSYFGISKETFKKFDNSMIIVGDAPLGFVLPFFPSNDKIIAMPVRIPLTKKTKEHYFEQINSWNKNIYYLSIQKAPNVEKSIGIAKKNNFFINYNLCQTIETNAFPIVLCQMKKINKFDNNIVPELQKARIKYQLTLFTTLYSSSQKFIINGNNISSLLPEYLESHGYLDKSFGYKKGKANNWTQNNGWIGSWTCPDNKGKCFGVGFVGNFDDLKPIINKYKPQALQIFFPYPKLYNDNATGSGQLLMIFRAPTAAVSFPYTMNFTSNDLPPFYKENSRGSP